MATPEDKIKDEHAIVLEGVVSDIYPEMRFRVITTFQGIEHPVKCYVSGKMRKRFIEIKKGDKVRVKVSLYDIDNGIITYRLTERRAPAPQPEEIKSE